MAQLTGAAFTAGLTIFLARNLGTHGYGVLSLALGVAGLVLLPSDFGIANSVARFVAEHRDDRGATAAVFNDGLRLKLISAVVIAALLFALAPAIASAYRLHALLWPLRGAAVVLLGQSVMLIGVVFVASARTDLQWRTALAESAVEATATVALVLAGGGATGAAFGQAIGYLAGSTLTVWLLVRLLGRSALPRGLRFGADARRIVTYGGVLLIVDGAYTAFSQVDGLIIAADLHASAVGIFAAPMRLTVFLAYPGGALAAGVAPRLVRGVKGGPNVEAFLGALRLLLIVQAAITAFALGWASFVVKVALGGDYAGSASALRALAPYVFLCGFGSLVSLAANYLGEAGRRVPVAIATVIVNVVLDLLLVPRLGVIGACAGTDVAFALYAPAHLLICRRALHVSLAPLVRTALCSVLAGGAMVGVLFAFGDSTARLGATAAGAILGLIAFVTVLWVGGELTAAELRRAFGAVRARAAARRGPGASSDRR